jgi:hypothetical protein
VPANECRKNRVAPQQQSACFQVVSWSQAPRS